MIVAAGVTVGRDVGVAVIGSLVGEADGTTTTGRAVRDAVGELVDVSVGAGVDVKATVCVAVGVNVAVWEGTTVSVGKDVSVAVAVGNRVGELVGVAVVVGV